MSKKEKVHLHHGEAFDSADELLTEAITQLDAVNARIQEMLESESRGAPPESGEEAPPAASEAAPDEDSA